MRRHVRAAVHVELVPMQRPRHRGVDPPEGWEQVRVTRGERSQMMWRCPHTVKDLEGNWRRCSYMCRKDHTHSYHDHQYHIDPSEDELLKVEYRALNEESNPSFMRDVTHSLAVLAGEQSISASALCSPSMRKFIVEIVRITYQYNERNKRKAFAPDTLVGNLSRNELRKAIMQEGSRAYAFLANQMESYKYVNIMIDAATVLTMRVVHSTVSNPFSGCAPIPLRCTAREDHDWTIAEYITEISTILAEMASTNNFIPVAICYDRLPAQASAVRQVLNCYC